MKFSDKHTYMNNYYSDTPVYKIWIDVIAYLSPRTSFLIETFQYRFVELVCQREEVVDRYIKDNYKLELVYAHESRRFFGRIIDTKTGAPIKWKTTPPAPNFTKNAFSDLQRDIDLWLGFLKSEL